MLNSSDSTLAQILQNPLLMNSRPGFIRLFSVTCAFLLAFLGTSAFSLAELVPPTKCNLLLSDQYRLVEGQPVGLEHGSIVEGSADYGGLQPNYFIDKTHPSLKSLLHEIKQMIGTSGLDFWAKINIIKDYIAGKVLVKKQYSDEDYLALLDIYREDGEYISLGEYVDVGCGTCRENALLMHLALNEVGIESQYVYLAFGFATERGADHAVNIVNFNGKPYVVDSYFPEYHQKKYRELFKDDENNEFIPFKDVLPYPKYWILR